MPYDKKKKDETKRPSPKRKLSNITFENEGAHLALVSKEVGGPANGHDQALVLKATQNFSEEFIEKVQQVRVTMELPQFLQTFFNLYYDDVMVLAHLMGYEMPELEEGESYSYEEYIEDRVSSFELMKSLHESKNITSVISKMKEEEYLSVLKDQEFLEEVISKSQKTSTEVNSEVGADTEAKAVAKAENLAPKYVLYKQKSDGGWEPTETKAVLVKSTDVVNKVNSEEIMTEKVTTAQVEVEVVEKSALEAIEKAAKEDKEKLEKALADQKEELQKALDMVAKFEEEKKETITKARFASVKEAVKDEAKAEVLFKAVNLVQDQAEFDAVVKALKDMSELAEKGELFMEKGVSVEGEGATDNPVAAVAKLLKSKTK